jgi:hypothetical protein
MQTSAEKAAHDLGDYCVRVEPLFLIRPRLPPPSLESSVDLSSEFVTSLSTVSDSNKVVEQCLLDQIRDCGPARSSKCRNCLRR